jgi:hypothetical protein
MKEKQTQGTGVVKSTKIVKVGGQIFSASEPGFTTPVNGSTVGDSASQTKENNEEDTTVNKSLFQSDLNSSILKSAIAALEVQGFVDLSISGLSPILPLKGVYHFLCLVSITRPVSLLFSHPCITKLSVIHFLSSH